MVYNTSRNHLSMREYGRHVQRMVEYLLTIEDSKKRQDQAHSVIELMGTLNPHLRNVEDFRHKLWDHLFFISDFKLEVESPYPIPQKETYKQKPDPLPYPKRHPKYSHLGKNVELIINKALLEENIEKREGFANTIAYYMKLSYSNWHKELVQDDTIQAELDNITEGQLSFSNTPYVKHRNTYESDEYTTPGRSRRHSSYSAGNNRNRNSGSNNNNRGGGGYRSGNNNGGIGRGSNNNSGSNNDNRSRNSGYKKRY